MISLGHRHVFWQQCELGNEPSIYTTYEFGVHIQCQLNMGASFIRQFPVD
jgi:hypothetical protein